VKKALFIVVSLVLISFVAAMMVGCKAQQNVELPSASANPNPNPNTNPNPNPAPNTETNPNPGIPGPGDPAPMSIPPVPKGAKGPVGKVMLPHALWDTESNVLVSEGVAKAPGGKMDEKSKALAEKAAEADGRKNLLTAAWELDYYRKSGWKSMLMGPVKVDGVLSNVSRPSVRYDPDGTCYVVVAVPVKSVTLK
jgi:hypothetical protein